MEGRRVIFMYFAIIWPIFPFKCFRKRGVLTREIMERVGRSKMIEKFISYNCRVEKFAKKTLFIGIDNFTKKKFLNVGLSFVLLFAMVYIRSTAIDDKSHFLRIVSLSCQ